MSPILGRTSGVTVFATSLERKRNIIVPSGAEPHNTPTGATNFWDWSASHNDQVGSLDFDSNSSQMELGATDAGSVPPGWGSSGVGKIATKAASTSGIYRTSQGAIPDFAWGGDWTYEICFLVNSANDPSGPNSWMPYTINNDYDADMIYGMCHYWGGVNVVTDTVGCDFGCRLGEGSAGSGACPSTSDGWAVFRCVYDHSASDFSWETWVDDGSNGWTQKGSTYSYSKTSGDQVGPGTSSSSRGRIWLNSFGVHGNGTYGKNGVYFAWSVFYKSDKTGATPYIPS